MPTPIGRSQAVQRYLAARPTLDQHYHTSTEEEIPHPIVLPPVGPGHWVAEDRCNEIVDLLNPKPAVIVDLQRLSWALDFGFAGGETAGVLTSALSNSPVAASDWDPTSFADGLFISDMIDTCMQVRIEGFEPILDKPFLLRLITQPPRDCNVLDFRRAILKELAQDAELRSCFNHTYIRLYRLRDLFDSARLLSAVDDRTRRLDILTAIRDTIECMRKGFDKCESGLLRIHRFADAAYVSEGYTRLCELLDYENHLASVDLKLRLGADGRIRRFEIMRMSENRENHFYQSPLGRLWIRVLFFIRGYILSEGELINRWIDSIFEDVQHLLPPIIQLIGEMEFYLAALAFKDVAESQGLKLSFPYIVWDQEDSGSTPCYLRGLYNPLLFGQHITPVPCDIEPRDWATITIVTGPNSGGKTRLLQAIGIAQMLGQCGMYSPTSEARFNYASGLFVSLIAEAHADQREGRLGTELLRIRQLFEQSRHGSLIILDELCSGTNPSEGEEIFRLVVSLLRELKPCVFITTHFLQFASRLQNEFSANNGLCFLQVKLDEHDCPTYRFELGVAKTSLAQQTAARLGVTREELLVLIRRNCLT